MDTLDAFARRKLAALEAAGLKRALLPTERLDGVHVLRAGRRLISFSCNDYLGLAHDPRVLAAAHGALEQHGAGSGASRLITGEHPLLGALERRLAAFKGAEAACVFGSGYLTNAGVIATLTGANDLVLLDELVHSSLLSGAKLSGARVLTFRHNDVGHLRELLGAHRAAAGRCLVATDGVFSMDGDLAPVGDLLAACEAHDAWLMVDDAHGLGVVNGGRGAAHGHAVPLRMGTLSKALGSYGGYVCASAPVIDYLKTRARTMVYSTALPPATVAAALAALEIVESEPSRVAQPLRKARRFAALMDLPEAQSSIVPVIVGEARRAVALSRRLEERGYLVGAIRPPTVPLGTSRLRVTFSAAHSDEDVEALAVAMRDVLREEAP